MNHFDPLSHLLGTMLRGIAIGAALGGIFHLIAWLLEIGRYA